MDVNQIAARKKEPTDAWLLSVSGLADSARIQVMNIDILNILHAGRLPWPRGLLRSLQRRCGWAWVSCGTG